MAPGLPRDVCLGGTQVVAGYVELDEQHCGCSVPHPFLPGEGLYRTGDRGRWLADGKLAFLRRSDRQVKVRGYRVNLAEIERAAAGCAHHAGGGKTVAERRRTRAGSVLLRRRTACRSPDAATARATAPDAAGPLGVARQFAAHRQQQGGLRRAAAARRCRVRYRSGTRQRDRAAMYCRALTCEQLDARADFFTLGGNSLSALRLVIDINRQFGTALSVGQLMMHGSITEMAGQAQAAAPLVMPSPRCADNYHRRCAANCFRLQNIK